MTNKDNCAFGEGERVWAGSEEVSTGASGDLESATQHCHTVFSCKGFSRWMEEECKVGSNLDVKYDKPSPTEYAHIKELPRRFLQQQYLVVLNMLRVHRGLLDNIAERLMWDPIVDQEELAELAANHSILIRDT